MNLVVHWSPYCLMVMLRIFHYQGLENQLLYATYDVKTVCLVKVYIGKDKTPLAQYADLAPRRQVRGLQVMRDILYHSHKPFGLVHRSNDLAVNPH